jgi:type III secretory pathway component EscT
VPDNSLFEVLSTLLSATVGDLHSWLRAWARVAPAVFLVPIFGGSALPLPARAGLSAALAVSIAPALRPLAPDSLPLPLSLLMEAARGAPIAIGAALLVHTALMAGGAIDDLRGGRETSALPTFDGSQTPLGALFGLLIAIGLLESGAASKLVQALCVEPLNDPSLVWIVQRLATTVSLAVAVIAPVLGASFLVSAFEALLARAAAPAHITAITAPLRALLLLGVAAVALDRMALALLTFGGV